MPSTAPFGRGSASRCDYCTPIQSRDRRKRFLRLLPQSARVTVLATSLLGTLLSAQTEPLDQLFADRNYIELAEALHNSANLSPEQTAFYRGILANRRNAAADSIANLEIALPAFEAASDLVHLKVAYYILADDYSKTFRYADAASVYRKIERRFGASLPRQERQDVRDSLRKWEALSRAEPQTVRIEESFVINRTRDEAGILTVPVRFGEETVSCVFDTGANYSVLTLSLAKSLGLTLSEATIPVDAITGGEVAARLAVVPEFRLGAVAVKNAIFLIFEDRDLYIAPIKHQIRGIIGFPVIAALGRLTFHQNGEIEIGVTRSSAADAGEPNLYLEERTPLVAAAIDGKTLLFTLDSGATQSVLFASYYKLHRAEFSGKPVPQNSTGAGGTRANLAFYKESVELKFGEKTARLSHVPVYTEKLGTGHDFFYGNLGQDVLKQFDRYTLDFQGMRLEFE